MPVTFVIATPVRKGSSPYSSATAGERLTTVAPASGWRPRERARVARGLAGGASSRTSTVRVGAAAAQGERHACRPAWWVAAAKFSAASSFTGAPSAAVITSPARTPARSAGPPG